MRREGALQGWQVVPYICHYYVTKQWLIPSCRLEQENTQVQAMLGAAKVENGRAKDQLAAVKAKLKAKEESMARAQDEENTTRNRINLSKEQAGKESDRRLKRRCYVSERGDAAL